MWYTKAEETFQEANNTARQKRAIKLADLFYNLTGEVIPAQSGVYKLDYRNTDMFVYFDLDDRLTFFKLENGHSKFSRPCKDLYVLGSELSKIDAWVYAKPPETWFQADFIHTFPEIKVAF